MNNKYGYTSKTFKRWNKEKTEIIGMGGGKKLTTKQLQRHIQRLSYAGIICEKWTHNKPVKAKWTGLVSIETFNQANRGKVRIEENNGEYQILYNYKPQKKIYTRKRHNEDYPFKCLPCTICGKPLKGSASTGKSGKKFPSYHCARGHKRFSVKASVMENTVEDYLASLKYTDDYIDIIEQGLRKKFKEKQKELHLDILNRKSKVMLLKDEKERILENYLSTTKEEIKEMLEGKLVEKDQDIKYLEKDENFLEMKDKEISDITKYMRKIVEHPEKVLIDKANPLRQRSLLSLIFSSLPTYEELDSGTPKLSFVFMGYKGKSTSKTSTFSQLG